MKWVDQATCRPFRCAVVPYVGNGRGERFIDTGQDLDREHVYISEPAARAIAQLCGFVPPSVVDAQAQVVADLEQRLAASESELESLLEFERSAKYTLEHFGEKPRNKPGRKPSKEKVAQ